MPRTRCRLPNCTSPRATKWGTLCTAHLAAAKEAHSARTTERLKRQWREWQAEGVNPTAGGHCAEARRASITARNRRGEAGRALVKRRGHQGEK